MVNKLGPPGGISPNPPEDNVSATAADTVSSPTRDAEAPTADELFGSLPTGGLGKLKHSAPGVKVPVRQALALPRGQIDGPRRAAPPGDAKASILFSYVVDSPACLYNALAFVKNGKELFNARDRITVLKKLLKKDPKLSIDYRRVGGSSLVHAVVDNPALDGHEQAALLAFLGEQGADFNHCDGRGRNALDTAMFFRSGESQPIAIRALQEGGAKFSLNERIPVTGHLVGGWGTVTLDTPNRSGEIRLEGLTEHVAEHGLDPIFRDAIAQVQAESSAPIQKVLSATLGAWDENRDMKPLIHQIRLSETESQPYSKPVMAYTAWYKPSGHAVGLVGNAEADGYYLYACNTGAARDSERSIVRYKVSDPAIASDFLLSCTQDENKIRTLFTKGPKNKGLTRCGEAEQMPRGAVKAFQKRGNCPLASRKACLSALIWSSGQADNIPVEDLRKAYKKITTLIRGHGVREAIDVGHPTLMGKALIKMLTKADRPSCQGLAWELTLALHKHYHPDQAGALPTEAPPITSELFINTVGEVLDLSDLHPNEVYADAGRTLAQEARRKGNLQAADILDRYSKPGDGLRKLFRREFWRSVWESFAYA